MVKYFVLIFVIIFFHCITTSTFVGDEVGWVFPEERLVGAKVDPPDVSDVGDGDDFGGVVGLLVGDDEPNVKLDGDFDAGKGAEIVGTCDELKILGDCVGEIFVELIGGGGFVNVGEAEVDDGNDDGINVGDCDPKIGSGPGFRGVGKIDGNNVGDDVIESLVVGIEELIEVVVVVIVVGIKVGNNEGSNEGNNEGINVGACEPGGGPGGEPGRGRGDGFKVGIFEGEIEGDWEENTTKNKLK